MVGKCGRHGRSPLNPVPSPLGDPKTDTQAVVKVTEVVEATDDIHASRQGRLLLSRTAVTPGKASQALTEGRIEPLDVGGIDYTATLRDLQ